MVLKVSMDERENGGGFGREGKSGVETKGLWRERTGSNGRPLMDAGIWPVTTAANHASRPVCNIDMPVYLVLRCKNRP